MIGVASTHSSMVLVDADNTLWDTNQVYADAQLWLLATVEEFLGKQAPTSDRLNWLRDIDQALAEQHHAGLRYPSRLLAKAVALALSGRDIKTSTRSAWLGGGNQSALPEAEALRIENGFQAKLEQIPKLRDGVRAGLKDLRDANCPVMIVTEANRDRIIRLLERHGLLDLVDRVIESKKQCSLFERVLRLARPSHHVFMVGDQLQNDVRPAKQAGLQTIYFPGGFRPAWEPSEDTVRPDYRIQRFDEVPEIVLRDLARQSARG